jgi:RND family efflux transporter MFP subunit
MVRQLFNWKAGTSGIVMVAGALALYLTLGRAEPPPEVAKPTSVAATKVARADLSEDLVVEAEFRPYQEVDLHAKVAGYLENISVDIGDAVKQDQLLATLEIPELQDELEHAQAVESRGQEELKRAQAAYEEVRLAYDRLTAVDKAQPHLIAQQELDAARAKDAVAAASASVCVQQLRVARADIKKLETMLCYAQIAAPFSGVITKRYADPGALIQAGTSSSTQAMPLVRLSQLDRLRLVFPVTVSYAARVKIGSPVEVRISALSRTLSAQVSRITRKLEMATRTMDVEVDVDNPEISIFPGMYATAVLRLEQRQNVLALAVEAITDRNAPTVFLVNGQKRIEEQRVKLGLESPRQIEILEGLSDSDVVVFGSRSQLRPGQLVEPKLVESGRAK